mmetsp:Transcript_20014/g.37971  ORF Transcript_20014/g.37971 Transcript_20014/m.37971 type:complete len:1122 (-) Transcript_20014:162-3527(-)
MAPHPQYGSISNEGENEEPQASVELLPVSHTHGRHEDGATNQGGQGPGSKVIWTRHHCISYTIAAVVCLFSAHYWHDRAESFDGPHGGKAGTTDDSNGDAGVAVHSTGRVPMPPPLSKLDPFSELGFRSTTRTGLASPSAVWGDFLNSHGDASDAENLDGGGGEMGRISKDHQSGFTALPTNEWYMNLVSHRAAADPSSDGEVAHVYTIPYVLSMSPPTNVPAFPIDDNGNKKKTETMAGIELFLPVLKTSSTNMQMVFDKNNGVSLGTMVSQTETTSEPLTGYQVDSNEKISQLGVSLAWNNVNMKTHVVRGMPYGTVRFGKQDGKTVLPSIVSGNRPVSILVDSDVVKPNSTDSNSYDKNQMFCGSFTNKPIEQDPKHAAPISSDGKAHSYNVQREVVFHLAQSDFTWVAFFSKPVRVKCHSDAYPLVSVPGEIQGVQFRLDVVEVDEDVNSSENDDDNELVVRMALFNECTTGKSIIKEHCDHLASLGYETISSKDKSEAYLKVLRKGADLYPKSPLVGTKFPENDGRDGDERVTNVVFDWDVTSVYSKNEEVSSDIAVSVAASSLRAATKAVSKVTSSKPKPKPHPEDFIMFALPHHLETFADNTLEVDKESIDSALCLHTFHGRTCLVHGSKWNLPVSHGEPQSFLADRPPVAAAIPQLADALKKDIKFYLSGSILRGAADTYFSAKILAKVGRIIEIHDELQRLHSDEVLNEYSDADDSVVGESVASAIEVSLPSQEEAESLLDDLQKAVEIWLKPGGKENGGAEAEFLYDSSWGGFVNCGCDYVFEEGNAGNGTCENEFPDCPALEDVNVDFGNGWYNDHHFHYGYHIFAAAVVAKHRPEWGREYFEHVLLYIRDIANPSSEDGFFPMYRQKDWFLGNSWAAGLMSMELSPHGREQESSSEAIAAFEGIALYGSAMMNAFADHDEMRATATLVRDLGEFLTAMEVDAANRFWHIWNSKDVGDDSNTDSSGNESSTKRHLHVSNYPAAYPKPVVGMMYETMASFQTWFAPEDVVSYGIQLIPLTAVAERRDDPEWVEILYPIYADACEAANKANDGFCDDNGWSIVQAGLLAEIGRIDDALEMTAQVPDEVFLSDGACGNSRTNTIWFVSTRKTH